MAFVETLIPCGGRIIKVKEEMGILNPTARNRLFEIICALGYKGREDAAPSSEQCKGILEQLANGRLSSDKAIKRLRVKP